MSGNPFLVRTDGAIDYNWGSGAPANGMVSDGFSIRWDATMNATEGVHRFSVLADDGVRVWLDGQPIIDEWHDAGNVTYTVQRNLFAGYHTLRVDFLENFGDARITFWWEKSSDFPQWRGEYFGNANLSGPPVMIRNDVTVSFDWGTGSPQPGVVPVDDFAVRWARTEQFAAGTYTFYAKADDGVRVFIDNALVINEWHSATTNTYHADVGLAAGEHALRVEFWEQQGDARIQFWWGQQGSATGWRGEYYDNRDLSGAPALTRQDSTIDFRWGEGSPAPGIPADNFSVRWERSVDFQAGTYTFHARLDDGMRVKVDGSLVIDAWQTGGERELTGTRTLSAGAHQLIVEYFEDGGMAVAQLWWNDSGGGGGDNWFAQFWDNPDLAGTPKFERTDSNIDFDWGLASPAPGIPADNFSARWQLSSTFDSGTYQLNATVDDGVRVYVDDVLVIDQWRASSGDRPYVYAMMLHGDHTIRVEYYEGSFGAKIRFWYEKIN